MPSIISLLALVFSVQQTVTAIALTESLCLTRRTSPSPKSSVSTKTILETVKLPQYVTVISTPISTITPAVVSSTVTSTSTVYSESDVLQSTDTFTATEVTTTTSTIILSTQTITNTASASTTVISSATGTTTVPTPAGFLPVQSTLPNSAAKKRRGLSNSKGVALNALPACPLLSPGKALPPSWPAAVTCLDIVESFIPITIKKTASTTSTITAVASTTIFSTTTTVTSTTVIVTPDADTTVTVTQTLTLSITSTPSPVTTTTTATSTFTAPTYSATAYAQCGAPNLIGTVNGLGIASTSVALGLSAADTTSATITTPDAETCCSVCAANPTCGISAFYAGTCYIISSGTCAAPGQYEYAAGTLSYEKGDSGYIVSNGNCGEIDTTQSLG